MVTLDYHHLTEVRAHLFVTEASTLGVLCGEEWPAEIPVVQNFGNGRPLVCKQLVHGCGVYQQEFGCILVKVFDD